MYVCSMDIDFASFYDFWIGIWNDICFGLFFFLLFCMFFSLPIRFFYFQTIYLYIYTTTAVQTEKQKNVLNLEPLSVVL